MRALTLILVVLLCSACTPPAPDAHHNEDAEPRGEHGGRLFLEEDVSLELLIFEATGTPEFRAWIRRNDELVLPEDIDLTVTLDRLGEPEDVLSFRPAGEMLISEGAVREPHSFGVTLDLRLDGRRYQWTYETLEGRTAISPEMAEQFGLTVEPAGPARIQEVFEVFGVVQADPDRSWSVQARFPGVIRSVAVRPGDRVNAGMELALVESDESLKSYRVTAPSAGVVVERNASAGEQSAGRTLFRIVDQTEVWALFRIFPAARAKVRSGQRVSVQDSAGALLGEGVIDWVAPEAGTDQSVLARVVLNNVEGKLLPGMRVTGRIQVAEHAVDLAVRRSGLQQFRDFTVVYRRVDDLYEVRMLELGRRDAEWVEVLSGLNAGDVYVTGNSYLVKADIDKDSAVHEH